MITVIEASKAPNKPDRPFTNAITVELKPATIEAGNTAPRHS